MESQTLGLGNGIDHRVAHHGTRCRGWRDSSRGGFSVAKSPVDDGVGHAVRGAGPLSILKMGQDASPRFGGGAAQVVHVGVLGGGVGGAFVDVVVHEGGGGFFFLVWLLSLSLRQEGGVGSLVQFHRHGEIGGPAVVVVEIRFHAVVFTVTIRRALVEAALPRGVIDARPPSARRAVIFEQPGVGFGEGGAG